jgi:hypothetical protein
MKRRSIMFSTLLFVAVASARASAQTTDATFSGIVTHVSTTSITVVNTASKKSENFSIVPTHGYGAVSADGKTTYQYAAIAVGWDLKIAYREDRSRKRHADHIVLLRTAP